MDDDICYPDHNPVRYIAGFFGELAQDAIRTSKAAFSGFGHDAGRLTFSVITR